MKYLVIGLIVGVITSVSVVTIAGIPYGDTRPDEYKPDYSQKVCLNTYPKRSKLEQHMCHLAATNYLILDELKETSKKLSNLETKLDAVKSEIFSLSLK